MKTVTCTLAGMLLSAGMLTAQLTQLAGPGTLISPVVENFEGFASGPAAGICLPFGSAAQTGTFTVSGDTMTVGSNVNGQALVSVNNVLSIAGPGEPLDNSSIGATWIFTLSSGTVATQFGFLPADQVNHSFNVETWLGGVLQNTLGVTYSGAFPNPPVYFEDLGAFDEFRVVNTQAVGWGLDDVTVANISGVAPAGEWQANSSLMRMTIDGREGGGCALPQITKDVFNCAPVIPATGTFAISSTEVGAVYDVVISALPAVGASTGGVPLVDGQIVNIDLFGGPFSFLSGGMITTIPTGFPGASVGGVSFGFAVTTASFTTFQSVVFSGASPLGFILSQASELIVVNSPVPTSVAGPSTGNIEVVSVDVTAVPTCWVSGGVPFYGTTFSTLNVSAGGYVSFGGTDTDTTPSTFDAISDDGRVGFWTDLDPSEGGTITISNPSANVIQVDWNGVFYNTGGPGNTFSVSFDAVTGDITVGGLQGIMNNVGTLTTDDQWLGISPGISIAGVTTTDPGPAGFALGGNGVAGVETDMLYEFNDTSLTLSGIPASVVGGLNTLTFMPAAVGLGSNYVWVGT